MPLLAAATLDEGPLGLEAWHTWRTVVLNQLDIPDEEDVRVPVWPRFKLLNIDGLHSRADRSALAEARTGMPGETAFPGASLGKTITYSGVIQSRNLPDLRRATTALRNVCNDPDDSVYEMEIEPHPLRGGVSFSFLARVLSCDIDDEQDLGPGALPSPWEREFEITYRMVHPFFLALPAVTTDETDGGDTVDVESEGNAPSDPYWVLNGPLTDEITVERTTGDLRHLTVATELLEDMDLVTIAFYERTVTGTIDDEDVDLTPYVTMDSTYWDNRAQGVAPGPQTLRASGCDTYTVSFRHAVN